MNRRVGSIRTLLGIVLSVSALGVVAGCTYDSAPTGINRDAPQGVQLAIAPDLVNYSSQQTQQLLDSGLPAAYMLVNARKGGKITNGAFTLTIPGGALAQDTQISLAPASAYQMACQVEPTGLQLRPGYQATLAFTWSGTDAESAAPSSLNARWFDPSNSQWVRIDGAGNAQKKRFDAYLTHFSYYALAK